MWLGSLLALFPSASGLRMQPWQLMIATELRLMLPPPSISPMAPLRWLVLEKLKKNKTNLTGLFKSIQGFQ
jgi:hypothetical protein